MTRPTKPIRRTLGAGAIAICLAVVSGCADDGPQIAPPPSPVASACVCDPSAAPVVDAALVAFLSKARAAHHEADVAEANGDVDKAIDVLARLAAGPKPPGNAPEVAEVLADTRARLADLRSTRGAFDPALADVEEGLRLATDPTHFRGRLFEVKGLVLERRSKALKSAGDAAGAAKAAEDAIAAFEQAIKIQDEVIKRALP